jgi:hypothetical protein
MVMALCTDPAVTYLRGFGFNVVRLPRASIQPLDLLGQGDGPLIRLGPLSDVWKTEKPEPKARPDETVDIKAQSSAKLKLSIGVRVLDSILQGLTGTAVGGGLDGAFENADGIVLSFDKPYVLGLSLSEIGEYLAAGDFNTKNTFIKRYLEDDYARLFLITSVLQSASIKVKVLAQGSAKASVNVDALKKSVKGKLSVERSSKSTQEIEFRAKKPVTFGFEAFEVTYRDDGWHAFDPLPAGDGYLSASNKKPKGVMLSEGRRVLIAEKPKKAK